MVKAILLKIVVNEKKHTFEQPKNVLRDISVKATAYF